MPFVAKGQMSAIDSLAVYHATTAENSGKIQQEMIYLHLDNTSYYRGDRIFFACYLVTSGHLKPSNLSKTVYVELLNPNGKIIDRCVLHPENGRCHGSLLADETPFYSGYYEIRAYTRYMLNFGPEAIFSRVIPIYAAPQKEGNWAERTILKHDPKTMPMSRPKTPKIDKVDLKFYPEGGHLVSGLPARVAFELTDNKQRPLTDISGRIVDRTNDSIVATFRSGHMGRGTINFTPATRRYSAEVIVDGKRYWCDLPKVEQSGIALKVDNLEDSIEVSISRTPNFPTEAVGVSLTCRGELYGRSIVDLSEQSSVSFKMSTAKLPTGVCQLTLFNAAGQPIADRLFFHNRHEFINIGYSFDKPAYRPFEKVELTVNLTDSKTGAPVSAPFSISVTDADNHVANGSNMMADLLLSSEIKGYVYNPAYYFEDGKEEELDNLLMVQGWRRYRWRQLAGMEEIRLDSLPEQGIEIRGQVLERLRDKPRAAISVSALLSKLDTFGVIKTFTFVTDDNGRFLLRDSLFGDWMMITSSSNKKKVSNNRILLDTSERPEPRLYYPGELNAELDSIMKPEISSSDSTDSDSKLIIPGAKLLNEVEVTAKYGTAWEMAQYMENSVASYDITDEGNRLRDGGSKFIKTLKDVLPEMDSNFYYVGKQLMYNGKKPLFFVEPEFGDNKGVVNELMGIREVIDSDMGPIEIFKPEDMPLDYVKKIFINTQPSVIAKYYCLYIGEYSLDSLMAADRVCGCVVFLELHPDKRTEMGRGMRRNTIKGYSTNIESYYEPNYTDNPPVEPDYRRTLYWNPLINSDPNGQKIIEFFLNGKGLNNHSLIISVVTPLIH